MFAPKNWLECPTNGNGSCGYHSFAEIFVRMVRNHPEFINPMLFDSNNPVFKPLQDFLKHSLELQEPISLPTLQSIFSDPNNKFNSDFIFKNIAPGVLLLFLSHYRHTTAKIQPIYTRIYRQTLATEGWSSSIDDRCFDEAIAELGFSNQISSIEVSDIEKEYYLHSLKMSVTGSEEVEHDLIRILSRSYPFINEFLSIEEVGLSPSQATSFINLIQRGFPGREYADQGLLLNVAHILFRPSVVARASDGNPNLTFPCAFGYQDQLTDVDWEHQHYALYQCVGFSHFEYAISNAEIRAFHERASIFPWSFENSPPTAFPRARLPALPIMTPIARCHERGKALKLIDDIKNISRPSSDSSMLRKDISFSFFDLESLLSVPLISSMFALSVGGPLYLGFKILRFIVANPISTALIIGSCSAIIAASESLYDYYCHYYQRRSAFERSNREIRRQAAEFVALSNKIAPVNKRLVAQVITTIAEEKSNNALRFFENSRPPLLR